jgi:hypothetical protein
MSADELREQLVHLRLLDREERVVRWPTKAPQRRLVLDYLIGHFAPEQAYTENEVNEILKRAHAFGDWALLRRELVDRRYLARDDAGRTYRASAIGVEIE